MAELKLFGAISGQEKTIIPIGVSKKLVPRLMEEGPSTGTTRRLVLMLIEGKIWPEWPGYPRSVNTYSSNFKTRVNPFKCWPSSMTITA